MPESMLLRLDPAILREVKKRARAENRTPAEFVETAVREKLLRTQVMVAVHPSVRKSIRKSKTVGVPGEARKDRAARRRLHHLILDAPASHGDAALSAGTLRLVSLSAP